MIWVWAWEFIIQISYVQISWDEKVKDCRLLRNEKKVDEKSSRLFRIYHASSQIQTKEENW